MQWSNQSNFPATISPISATNYVDGFLFPASMIAMAQAIMKIISNLPLTRMIWMVQDTQIARKKLFHIDQRMNINHFRGLSKRTFFFGIQRRATLHFFVSRNYSEIKKSSIQSFREF